MGCYCCNCHATFSFAIRDGMRQPCCPFCQSRAITKAKPQPFVQYDLPSGKPPGKRRKGGNRRARELVPKLAEREGWVCHLCKGMIDPRLREPDPQRATIDHLVPLSLGGSRGSKRNMRLAHFACNSERGNAPLEARCA
jgi:5-methylcytosine-specific restriction endonuclease McrA